MLNYGTDILMSKMDLTTVYSLVSIYSSRDNNWNPPTS